MSKYQFIEAEKVNHKVRRLCHVVKVSHAAYYKWSNGKYGQRHLRDLGLVQTICSIYAKSKRTYGAPRVHSTLRDDHDIHISRKKVAWLMKLIGLSGLRKPRKKYNKRTPIPSVSDLVQRNFALTAKPNVVWFADITQIRVAGLWLYLAVVLDCHSRKVVGWSMSHRITAHVVRDAVRMAIQRRRPKAGTVHHSDRGKQFIAKIVREEFTKAKILQSVGQPGTCYDNAVMESFFATFKKELIYRNTFTTSAELKTAIVDYIECWYNPLRKHSTLGYLSPAQYEEVIAHQPDLLSA